MRSTNTPTVSVTDAERMNLLGLILASVLERRLQHERAARHARALDGDVVLDANGMRVTLRFGGGRIEVTRDEPEQPTASVRGTLGALLAAALGKLSAGDVLSGRLRVRGRPMALWHVFSLMRG